MRTLILSIATLLVSGCISDVLEVAYPTMSDAIADGAVERGWIPAWTPAEAKDLREVHNVDSNQSALVFTTPLAWRPPAQCHHDRGGGGPGPAFNRRWLPSSDRLESYELYRCPSGVSGPVHEMVAVGRGAQHVVHWRVSER